MHTHQLNWTFLHRSASLLVFVLLVVLSSSWGCHASEGDESTLFQQCHASCLSTGCTKSPGSRNTCDTVCLHKEQSNYKPPWFLYALKWDCDTDCSYHCMWALEAPKAAATQGPVWKYYGKWPFVRVLGAQEIASVAFSLANLAAHVHNLHLYLRFARAHRATAAAAHGPLRLSAPGTASGSVQYPFHGLWVAYAAANINAWLWSSVFHCRDTRVTERLDYFSADLVVAVGCGVVLARMLHLTSAAQLLLLSLILGLGLLQHIYYMAFVKFDYGYNMTLCIAVGVCTAVAWLVWVTQTKHPGRWTLYKFMAAVHVAMLLEVLDFPPLLQLFDAHALWHAATVPLTYLWYKFIEADVLFCQPQQLAAAGESSRPTMRSSTGVFTRKHKQ